MEKELDLLAKAAGNIHTRMVCGTPSEFERARLLRDMANLATNLRTAASRAAELSGLILTLGGDGPHDGGGRAA